MKSEDNKTQKKFNAKWLVIALIFILIMSAGGIFVYASSVLGYNKIYKGVSIGNIDVGCMTKAQAKSKLESYFKSHDEMNLNFKCDDIEFEISASSLSLKANIYKAVDKAYQIGRNKKSLENLKNIMSCKKDGYTVDFEVSFDKDRLIVMINESVQNKTVDSTPMNVEIGTDKLYVTNAIDGKGIDKEEVISEVEKRFKAFDAGSKINLNIVKIKAKNLTADEFYNKYNREAKNAVYTKTEDGYKIEPEVVGISLNKADVKNILEENKNNTQTYEIPAEITQPEITAKQLEDKYVNHIIASYTTSYGGSSANRCSNIALAASKINGYVINPGKRFSYNKVVGPRTQATGFKNAHVYVGTQVVDGIGGGICQVSSTLYNAAVLSDLKIVSRTNHSIPVSYAPLGRDATVSYGSIDFVFENDKSYPVSIKAVTSGQSITISIVGAQTMDYKVEFYTEFVKSIPYSTEKVNDSSLLQGQTKIVSNGSNGSIINSYRVYKKDGKEYKRKFESKSTYSAVSAKMLVGTSAKQESIPQPEVNTPQSEQSNSQTSAKENNNEEQTQPVQGTDITNDKPTNDKSTNESEKEGLSEVDKIKDSTDNNNLDDPLDVQ